MNAQEFLNLENSIEKLVYIDNQIKEAVFEFAYEQYKTNLYAEISYDAIDKHPQLKINIASLMAVRDAILGGKSCYYEHLFEDANTSLIMQIFGWCSLSSDLQEREELKNKFFLLARENLAHNWSLVIKEKIWEQIERLRDAEHDYYEEVA